MRITTERLILRSFEHADLQPFADLRADPDVMRFLGGPLTYEASEIELLNIIDIEKQSGLVRFALERKEAGGLVGVCGFKPAGEFVDLSYMIAKRFWGQGYAFEAAQRVRRFGLTDLMLTNIEAGGAVENVASIKILERLEFNHRQELQFDGQPSVRFFD